jgi:hypothetical protein
VAGIWLGKGTLREKIARSEERERAQEEKYAQMKADVDKVFSDVASRALRDNNASFLQLAEQKLGAQANEAQQTLATKETAIKNMLDPLNETLGKLDAQARAMDTARSGAYAKDDSRIARCFENRNSSADHGLARSQNPRQLGRIATEALCGVRRYGAVLFVLRASYGAR